MSKVGHCVIRGNCGSKSIFGQQLPCPDDGPAQDPESDEARSLLVNVCGEEFAEAPVCCLKEQVETLRDRFDIVENFLSSCPACRNNFRSFFCSFTCSQDQGLFLNVTATQTTRTGQTAVKSIDFFVGESFTSGFYESCKNVQYGASNQFAMDFIGGGAKDAKSFLKYLGDEKDLGSPFQIDFRLAETTDSIPYDPTPRNCADSDLRSRCTCLDCPSICQELPPITPPGEGYSCRVGRISCLTFALTNIYGIGVIIFLLTYSVRRYVRSRQDKKYERVALAGDHPSDNPLSPRSNSRSLVGASSLSRNVDGEESLGGQSGESRHLGRGASLLDPLETVQPRQYQLNTVLRRWFYKAGLLFATYPWATFAIIFAFTALLNLGWKKFEVETDPVRLWVAPDSESRLQKEFFDEHFGPFYRTEQVFITAVQEPSLSNIEKLSLDTVDLPPVLTWDHLKWWSNVEKEIRTLQSSSGVKLTDICFAPAGPGTPCVVQSFTAYFGGDVDGYEDSWEDQITQCTAYPAECLPDFKQPLSPQYIFGGLPGTAKDGDRTDWLQSRALIVTFVVSDSVDPIAQQRAADWEVELRKFLEVIRQTAPAEAGLHIEFSTGVSLEEEISKSTNTDVKIVVLSYLIMFFYVATTLGNGSSIQSEETSVLSSIYHWAIQLPHYFRYKLSTSGDFLEEPEPPHLLPRLPRRLIVGSKFTLGLFGILLVILSISSSFGLFSILGVRVTLIIAEVIPFLVLAVGVDNVFILVHELDRQNLLHGPNAAAPTEAAIVTSVSNTHAHPRPSPFSSSHEDNADAVSVPVNFSAEERVARALAKMGPSILLSSVTETTAFALGALVPMPAVRNFALYAAGSVFLNALLQVTVFVSAMTLDLRRVEANRLDCFPCFTSAPRIALSDSQNVLPAGRIARFMRRRFVPFILQPFVKGIILVLFTGLFVGSIISMQHIELGLDQRLALPSESYLIPYFDALDNFYEIGPPVYFVASDVNVTSLDGQQKLCGKFTTCDPFSLANVLEAERKRPESSFISQPTASWVDAFLNWLDPLKGSCCRVRKSNPELFCGRRDPERLCRACFEGRQPAWNITMEGFPEGEELLRYLYQWIRSPSDEDCALGGLEAYSTALSFDSSGDVDASSFRTFHSPLKSQADFINSLHAGHRVAEDITQRTGISVFPYAIHYVFFDQYAHIIAMTQEVLGLGLASVLFITAFFLGSWRTGLIVTGVVALIVVNVMGVMGLWSISLNAISLVNLVISLGIAVEFCAHIARAFMGAGTGLPIDQISGQKERDERVWNALTDVGPSVISGITFTKLIGISVMAFTRSKFLEIYYFRMWLVLIVSGAFHGIVLLPIILSFAGGNGYALEDADEEWMSSTVRRRDYEYTPFLADDDSIHSD